MTDRRPWLSICVRLREFYQHSVAFRCIALTLRTVLRTAVPDSQSSFHPPAPNSSPKTALSRSARGALAPSNETAAPSATPRIASRTSSSDAPAAFSRSASSRCDALFRAAASPGRRRDCHFADTPSPSILKGLLKGAGGVQQE